MKIGSCCWVTAFRRVVSSSATLPGVRFCYPDDLRPVRDSARRGSVLESQMRKEYDFSKSRKNPYATQLKSQITIRLDTAAVAYFKQMAAELGMPYQNLINLFLRDCAQQKRRPSIQWLANASTQTVRR